jgi:hypothetical protein
LNAVVNNGKGVMPTMTYNTNAQDKKYAGYYWHSNQLVPFFAKGAGAVEFLKVADLTDPVRGAYLDNTEISVVIRQLIGTAPSPWAVKDVYLAVDRNLVPKSLQENYKSDITKIDICILPRSCWKSLTRNLTAEPTEENPMPFTDTNSDVVYTINQLKLIEGKTATEFGPGDVVTRQDAAVLFNNLASYLKCAKQKEIPAPRYADDALIADNAKEAVANCYILGILKSTGRNSFSPTASLTVEQAICAMLRIYKIKNPHDIYVWDVAR